MNGLTDRFRRRIDYMRISVTDRCNLRCIYCMPPEGLSPIEHREILRYEEIVRVMKVAARVGVRKVRITGGEPLVRKNIPHLIQLMRDIDGISDLSLTTNGALLEEYAEELAAAGLGRVNISLDSLKPERYREITRGGDIEAVFRGIEAARKAGLLPVKINIVPIRGLNDDEIIDFARMTLHFPYQVRFIEFMPIGRQYLWKPENFMSVAEIRSVIGRTGRLNPAKLRKSGPARYFKFDGAAGVIGFISPLSNHFCGECSRLRLTADGKLRPCLFSETEIDLKPALRSDAPDYEIERLIRLSIEVKPEGHNINLKEVYLKGLTESKKVCGRPMSKIGG
jgi:cyclic pyranopterin phosphate synthase